MKRAIYSTLIGGKSKGQDCCCDHDHSHNHHVALDHDDDDDPDEHKYNKVRPRVRRTQRRRRRCKEISTTIILIEIVIAIVFLMFWFVYRLTQSSMFTHKKSALFALAREKQQQQQKQHLFDLPHANDHQSRHQLEAAFAAARQVAKDESQRPKIRKILDVWLQQLNEDILKNRRGGHRWIRPYLLPPMPDGAGTVQKYTRPIMSSDHHRHEQEFFKVDRMEEYMEWEREWKELQPHDMGPAVDYTDKNRYSYPPLLSEPPAAGGYPQLTSLREIMTEWHQDNLDHPPDIIQESLLHFNYSNPEERAMAQRFRDHELPFKLYDIPEIDAATSKWTDDYVNSHFEARDSFFRSRNKLLGDNMPNAHGSAQESPNNYFAFFIDETWDIYTMGLPPTRNNDWNFEKWSEHAKYADAVRLSPDQPHFYWQSGVPAQERHQPQSKWTFISRDLPSFSSPTDTFFVFHPQEQKGIQCRFGERGVVAATHYDGGRNMIAMITGAKRYILSPPNQCSRLGIFTPRKSAIFRHSLLNFGHIVEHRDALHDLQSAEQQQKHHEDDNADNDSIMSEEERAWLQRAGDSKALSTVLKQGEVLYLPSHWFHYIVSLQKSAQCNVRSGIDMEGTAEFGGSQDVLECV